MKFKPMQGGGELLPHQIGYPREFLTLGASPIDNPDCRVTLDRKPVSGPPGTILLRIRTETTIGFNDCFFWIAPEPRLPGPPARDPLLRDHGRGTTRPRSSTRWSGRRAAVGTLIAVRFGRIERHGDDLPAKLVAATAATGKKMGPVTTTSYRYFVDFK